MPELVKKKGAFSRIEDTMFPQNNFLLLADYNFCLTHADKKIRLWNEGEFSSLFRVFFFIKDFFQAVEIRQDCCQLLFLLFLSSFFCLFFFFLPAFPDTIKIQGFGRCREKEKSGKEERQQFFRYGLLPDIFYLFLFNCRLQDCCMKSGFSACFSPLTGLWDCLRLSL